MDVKLSLNIDLASIQKDAQEAISNKAKQILTFKTYALFYDEHNNVRPHPNDPDTGLMLKVVNSAITEVALDPKWEQYAKHRAEELFKAELDAALLKAAKHKANQIAFNPRPPKK